MLVSLAILNDLCLPALVRARFRGIACAHSHFNTAP